MVVPGEGYFETRGQLYSAKRGPTRRFEPSTQGPSKIQYYNSPVWAVFAQRDRSLPARDQSLVANPKNQRSGTGLSRAGPVSHCENALGDRSRPPGTGCLRCHAPSPAYLAEFGGVDRPPNGQSFPLGTATQGRSSTNRSKEATAAYKVPINLIKLITRLGLESIIRG
uniref:Uncharacterized protein n=1 Tax=Ananas comosus var. bracteatus TaxID=296719 RepID=A0A6V7NT44_ANACO|nr:unnamed protein product [Ananas comosus var. bracteatus]